MTEIIKFMEMVENLNITLDEKTHLMLQFGKALKVNKEVK